MKTQLVDCSDLVITPYRDKWAKEINNTGPKFMPIVKLLIIQTHTKSFAHFLPTLGRSPGGGSGNPLQYPFLENPMAEEPGR